MVCSTSGPCKCIKWKRFATLVKSQWHFSSTSTDAIIFKPKRDIYFFGIGIYANDHQKDMTMSIWWGINDAEVSEKLDKLFIDGEKDEESCTHDFNFVDMGLAQKVKVSAEEDLEIYLGLKDSGSTTCWYGNDGQPENYNALEQEQDFEIKRSNNDGNGTSAARG